MIPMEIQLLRILEPRLRMRTSNSDRMVHTLVEGLENTDDMEFSALKSWDVACLIVVSCYGYRLTKRIGWRIDCNGMVWDKVLSMAWTA